MAARWISWCSARRSTRPCITGFRWPLVGVSCFTARRSESVDPARFIDPATMYSLHRVNPAALAASNAPAYRAALAELAACRATATRRPARSRVPRRTRSAGSRSQDLRDGASQTVDMSVVRDVAPPGTGEAVIDRERGVCDHRRLRRLRDGGGRPPDRAGCAPRRSDRAVGRDDRRGRSGRSPRGARRA